jgi:diadenosine tetraphosphatase ApaH/serine/threonine PP2A family protein phosphatase
MLQDAMLIAILSDIHANREALDACLAHARRAGAERFVFLGDLVGYGADPAYVVDLAAAMQADGAIVIMGNHDEAVGGDVSRMNSYARVALEWTRDQLSRAQMDFLAGLPLSAEDGEVLYVHSEATNPAGWIYVLSAQEADRSMDATEQRVVFCGHVHRPQLYHRVGSKPAVFFQPCAGMPIPLVRSHKWQAVLGSVGQPRDEIASAAYALYDDTKSVLTFHRVAYDIERAARKIKAAGLPQILSARLFIGR